MGQLRATRGERKPRDPLAATPRHDDIIIRDAPIRAIPPPSLRAPSLMLGRGRRAAAEPIDPELLLRAYSVGVFPMADGREAPEIFWVEPKKRGVMPLDRFHLSRSLAKRLRSGRYRVTADRAFSRVVATCAEAAAGRPETWINGQIEDAYGTLHKRGHAHSLEVWEGNALVGGLYGVSLGRAFFGESMFSRVADASKVAMAHLVARLRCGGYSLLDCQFITDHLASLGAIEIGRTDYRVLLDEALAGTSAAPASSAGAGSSVSGDFFAADRIAGAAPPRATAPASSVSGPTSGWVIAQLLGQTS
jgi:leucyl/phenylalanyl-tRNA--protein transferase